MAFKFEVRHLCIYEQQFKQEKNIVNSSLHKPDSYKQTKLFVVTSFTTVGKGI